MDVSDNLATLQTEIADKALLTLALLSPVLVALSLSRARVTGWENIYLLHILFAAVIIAATLLRKRMPFRVKSALLVATFFLLGILGQVRFGIAGQGTVLLTLSALYAVTFFGRKAIWPAIAVIGIVMTVTWVGTTFHWEIFAKSQALDLHAPEIAGAKVIMTGLLLFLLLSTIGSFIHSISTQTRVLDEQKQELEETLGELKTLRGVIPICSRCNQIRDDDGSWDQLEKYIQSHSNAVFSHGICPTCYEHTLSLLDNNKTR